MPLVLYQDVPYIAVGVSTDVNGNRHFRASKRACARTATGRMRHLGDHTDIIMLDLPTPMLCITEAWNWLQKQGIDAPWHPRLVTRSGRVG
jgi:hypothetical protein